MPCYRFPSLGSSNLKKHLEKAGFATELRRGDADDPIPALLSVSDRHDNRVDLLAGLRGLDPLAFSRSITVPFLGGSLRVIGREDFIAMKCFAGGPQDIGDAVQALKTVDQPLDVELLRRTRAAFWKAGCGRVWKRSAGVMNGPGDRRGFRLFIHQCQSTAALNV